ncbi:MAG: hypothetical protein DI565_19345 [Ancylobacter novellus]|uniref:Uncharacterized protein n=1 Tax=Ancylobacter novellus TaxID=921 RepID=A0A2W5K0W7_ANCNO|nr:MAG: hypothetical protein DI565_19345 [Ancylobacter novellus]
MSKEQRSTYGTTVAKPDAKAGLAVGGGEKPAAEEHSEDQGAGAKPGSRSDSEHERRPEGPHDPDKADETGKPR